MREKGRGKREEGRGKREEGGGRREEGGGGGREGEGEGRWRWRWRGRWRWGREWEKQRERERERERESNWATVLISSRHFEVTASVIWFSSQFLRTTSNIKSRDSGYLGAMDGKVWDGAG